MANLNLGLASEGGVGNVRSRIEASLLWSGAAQEQKEYRRGYSSETTHL